MKKVEIALTVKVQNEASPTVVDVLEGIIKRELEKQGYPVVGIRVGSLGDDRIILENCEDVCACSCKK